MIRRNYELDLLLNVFDNYYNLDLFNQKITSNFLCNILTISTVVRLALTSISTQQMPSAF